MTQSHRLVPTATQISTGDRFQGALLGLWLVPRAVAMGSDRAADEWDDWVEAVALGFGHILTTAFDSLSPQGGQRPVQPSAGRLAPLPLWLTDIADLLRYHDSQERRWQRFMTKTQASEAQAAAEAQRLIFGDLLGCALSGGASSPVDCLGRLQKRPQLCGQPSVASRHYQEILTELRAQLPQAERSPTANETSWNPCTPGLCTPGLTAAELADHTAFISGVLSALTYPESYCLSVQTAAQQGGTAALAAGILAGAISGPIALPVLWQTGLGKQIEKQDRATKDKMAQLSQQRLTDVTALAARLFEQWAGILPAAIAHQS